MLQNSNHVKSQSYNTLMMQFDTIKSLYVRHALTFFDSFMKMQGPEGKCKDEKENARTT